MTDEHPPAGAGVTERFSEHTLRIMAWVAALFMPVNMLIGLLVTAAEPPQRDAWDNLVGDLAFLAMVASFPLVGLLILRRLPRNRIGWILVAVGVTWGLSLGADSYSAYGLVVNPGSLPGAGAVAAFSAGAWAPGIGLMGTFLILLYPDGRLPSARWRPVAWTAATSLVVVTVAIMFLPGRLDESPRPELLNPIGSERWKPLLEALLVVFLPLVPLCIIACAVSLIIRFRRSRDVERLQLKWLAAAGAVVAVLYFLTMAVTGLQNTQAYFDSGSLWVSTLQTVSILSFVLLPTAIGVAILRHGLYGIDVVINRTLVYGSLTLTLAGIYAGGVLLLQLVVSPLTHQSDLAVAGSTLMVAALFRAVRSRIQSGVDRRFYRSRYDAARTVEAFASRLRHEVDLDAVGADLRATVEETVQPTRLSLWLRT